MIKKLSNGISYEFRECDMDICYVSLIVWNGSLKDRGRYGIAHFLEHMLMQMDYEGYGVGDDFSCVGTTSFEYTKYVISTHNEMGNILNAIRIILDIFRGTHLLPDNMEKVRQDIVNEYNVVSESPFFEVYRSFVKKLGISEYMPIGNLHDIRCITYMDIIENFKSGYSVENAHIIILGGEKEWGERIWKKIVENDFKVMPQNSSLRVPTSLNRNYKNIKENGTVIFLKLKYVCTDTVYYDLVESMALTFLEELFKEMGKIQESDIFVDIFQPIKDFRYIRITVRKKINLNCIYNVYKKIVNRLILKKDIERLLEDLKNEYNNILKKNEYGYQYIQHLIYSYIFDRKSYTNHDLMQYIEAESKKVFDDIIQFSISNLKDPQYYIYYLERR